MKKMYWLLILTLLLGVTAVSHAQDIVPEPPIIPQDVTIEYQRVNVTIADQVATTHIEQLFVNNNDWMLEGEYFFPLPEGAAVSQLTMWVDGQPIEAKILERDEAQQIYDNIVRQLRDPALLKYVGTQAIQANVFPIPPNDERLIEIEYTQVLPAENGLIHYVYPQSTTLYTNMPLNNQSIRVEVQSNEAIRAIYSPSHNVAINRDGDFRAVVGFEDSNVLADNDFELYYTVSPEEIGLNLLSYKEPGEDGFFLLLVAPSVETNEIAAKDVILVLDTSGSMEGEKLAQAREAAVSILDNLNPDDRFNVISFSTGTRSYENGLVSANKAADAQTFVNRLEAVGGTNISQALLEAVAQADSSRPTTIIFLTDGLATEGITDTPLLLNTLEQAAPSNVRIFAFGVGDDVDTSLLDQLAQNHRGTTTYVRPFQAIDEVVSAFYAKVSAPVLTDIHLDFDGIRVEQLYPQTLPDLFAGSQLVLVGRYRDGGPADITLSGTVNGRTQTTTYRDNFFRSNGGDNFIPRLWATRAIGHLLTEIRLNGENPELVQSVVNLSIRYGIITPYTSYLIEENDIFSQTGRDIIIEEEMEELSAEEDAVSGAEAVEEAAASADLAEAEAPMAAPMPMATAVPGDGSPANGAPATQPIQFVGSKTFVLRNGVWMDTAFDADTMTPQMVTFASDGYFDLVTAVPELGQYFALGEQVLVVMGDQVYQTTTEPGSDEITLPETTATEPQPDTPTPAPETAVTTNEPTDEPPADNTPTTATNTGAALCASALILPMLLAGGWAVTKKSGQQKA